MQGKPIGDDGFRWLDPLVKVALDRVDELSDWPTDFVSSLADRLGRYGRNTFMTGKQWDQIVAIADRLGIAGGEDARDAGAA